MISFRSRLFIASLLALGISMPPAQAQLARTFVSSFGNDANDCNRSTPCRTFQGAHDKTFDQGEIAVLDTGGYGAVTITKSISIVSEVGEASILVSGGVTGITINSGPAAYVSLRGLTIQGIGFGGGTGLVFNSAFALTITNCVIRNHTGNGIVFQPNIDGQMSLTVSNTLVADNGQNGIRVRPTAPMNVGSIITANFRHVLALNNSLHGIVLDGSVSPAAIVSTVVDSEAANNGQVGFTAINVANSVVRMMLIRCVAVSNNTGISSQNPSPVAVGPIVRVGQSIVTGNVTSWTTSSNAFLDSYGDNNIDGNFDGDPAPAVIIAKK